MKHARLPFTLIAVTLSTQIFLHAQETNDTTQSWRASDGRVIQAKFIKLDGNSVVIEKDGKPFTVPFAKLEAASVALAKKLGGLATSEADPANREFATDQEAKSAALKKKESPNGEMPAAARTALPGLSPRFVLNNPNPTVDGFFGGTVAIDGTRVVVMASIKVASEQARTGSSSRTVYVYDLTSATPKVPVVTLKNPTASETFGYEAVAISGTKIVVGDGYCDTRGPGAGCAYVYDVSSATPTVPVFTLSAPNPEEWGRFGIRVAISGKRVVVSGNSTNTRESKLPPSAHIYDLESATPTVPVATLKNSNPAGSGRVPAFAISGTRVVVGECEVGEAYVYDLSNVTPTVPVATLKSPKSGVGRQFGGVVAISGTRLVVWDNSAEGKDPISHVYELTSATPTVPVVTLNNPNPGAGGSFGIGAISGTRGVADASLWDKTTGAPYARRLYVYEFASATPTVPVATLNNPSSTVDDGFGDSVAVSGERVVIGANKDDTGATDSGSVYVYDVGSKAK